MSKSKDDIFRGTDEGRTADTLKYAQVLQIDEPLQLEMGGELKGLEVTYETYGRLNDSGDNAILVCHALTGDSHVAAHDESDDPGWWDILIGPGKPVDTNRYFVICSNVLGGCRGTTGPNSINPETGRPYGSDFPTITIGDMVEVQYRLIKHLGVSSLLSVIGGSMGGHQVLCWARRFPEAVKNVIALATSSRLSSQSLAFDIVGRNAIRHDPNFNDGQFYGQTAGPDTGLALARMLGHITYLSSRSMSEKFEGTRNQPRDIQTAFEKEFSVGSYLAYKGQQFTQRFDANSYLALSMAMDLYDLGADEESLAKSLAKSRARWLVVSYTSDWLFPAWQSRQIVNALIHNNRPVSYCNVQSECGHDAFLLEEDLPIYGELVRGFLDNTQAFTPRPSEEGHEPVSIFHDERIDYDRIAELIEPGSSVLDLGCGRGGLLAKLARRGPAGWLLGAELSEDMILSCVRCGLDVVQQDLNRPLAGFSDNQFDVVVLSRTLQTIYDVEEVMNEMLRVGRQCIVSVPNFAFHKLQRQLAETGRTPEAAVLHHHWYNTPNIRVLTLLDFEEFCKNKGISIHRRIALDLEDGLEIPSDNDPNRDADMAIFVISRN